MSDKINTQKYLERVLERVKEVGYLEEVHFNKCSQYYDTEEVYAVPLEFFAFTDNS